MPNPEPTPANRADRAPDTSFDVLPHEAPKADRSSCIAVAVVGTLTLSAGWFVLVLFLLGWPPSTVATLCAVAFVLLAFLSSTLQVGPPTLRARVGVRLDMRTVTLAISEFALEHEYKQDHQVVRDGVLDRIDLHPRLGAQHRLLVKVTSARGLLIVSVFARSRGGHVAKLTALIDKLRALEAAAG